MGDEGIMRQFIESTTKWAKSNFPVVTESQFKMRLTKCRRCHYWKELAKTRVAICRQCNCTVGKLAMATSRCPLQQPKWIEIETDNGKSENNSPTTGAV